jgi:hypothetical protein
VVGLSVAGGVETVPSGRLARRGGNRRGGTQVRPGGLGAQPFGVVAGGDEQGCGGVSSNAAEGEEAWCTHAHEGDDELVEAHELAVEELDTSTQLS